MNLEKIGNILYNIMVVVSAAVCIYFAWSVLEINTWSIDKPANISQYNFFEVATKK